MTPDRNTIIRKSFVTKIAADATDTAAATHIQTAGDRTLRFTISTSDQDRVSDVISQTGWMLDNYKANPVVLWAHDDASLPIGRCTSIGVEGTQLKATVEFVPADMPVVGQLADAVYRMCRDGYLNATSVGFRALEWDFADPAPGSMDRGIHYKLAELTEFSIVPVPCNPHALIDTTATKAQEDLSQQAAAQDAERDQQAINNSEHSLLYRQRALTLLEIAAAGDHPPQTALGKPPIGDTNQ